MQALDGKTFELYGIEMQGFEAPKHPGGVVDEALVVLHAGLKQREGLLGVQLELPLD